MENKKIKFEWEEITDGYEKPVGRAKVIGGSCMYFLNYGLSSYFGFMFIMFVLGIYYKIKDEKEKRIGERK